MAGFTTQEMVDMLGLRLEDSEEDTFGASLKLQALNWAQLELTSLIHMAYLTELEVKDFNISCALDSGDDEGSIAFSLLSKQPLANGIQRVKINGGNWAHMIEADEVRKSVNTWHQGTNKRPLSYVQRERIYLAADDDTQAIDVHYLREPETMVAVFTCDVMDTAVADITAPDLDARHCVMSLGSPGFTADEFVGQTGYNKTQSSNFVVYDNDAGSLSVIYYDTDVTYAVDDEVYFTSADANVTNLSDAACELNPRLHGIVVDLAEAHLWRHDEQPERSKAAYQKAVDIINALNARYESEAPAGIGTGRK